MSTKINNAMQIRRAYDTGLMDLSVSYSWLLFRSGLQPKNSEEERMKNTFRGYNTCFGARWWLPLPLLCVRAQKSLQRGQG